MTFKVEVTWQVKGNTRVWERVTLTVRAVSRNHALNKAVRLIQANEPEWREIGAQLLTTYDLLKGDN